MAKNVQKTRTQTRAVQTAMKTALTQKQCLEAVQTLIHGGLSCIMFLRYLFTEDAFDLRQYKAGPVVPYAEYANAKLPTTAKTSEKAASVMILRRKGRRANLFLDWLEKGAFPLLEKGQLRAIRVNVHGDKNDRDKVVETYTFTFRYQEDESGVRSPAGVEVTGSEVTLATAGQVNEGLRDILKAVSKICKSLPYLPDDQVAADGFVPSQSDKLYFAHADGWSKQTITKTLGAAFYSTDVKISHLALSDPRSSSQLDKEAVIPEQLDYPTVISRLNELGLSDLEESAADGSNVEDQVTVVEDSQGKEVNPNKRTSSVTLDHELGGMAPPPASMRQMPSPFPTSQLAQKSTARKTGSRASAAELEALSLPPRPPPQDSLDTQSSHVPRMRKALQGMIASEPLTQGDTQTQAIIRPLAPTPSQTRRIATPTTVSAFDDDLDLRKSVAPYQTPLVPRLNEAKKRALEEDDVFSSSPNRAASNTPVFKRLKVLQSQHLFNANGLPSSPAPQHEY
ncbi:hypothetical protein PRZ48_006214 [Zasmidium cellare]|uniref:HORMA domain-containing protein n=1 Tax=Zasmidium cellare TaxID=395010 RepID=A0ABR0ENM8_ZASCE|nr:hypothetical protein PRZ48_006214 [Zasmidium cellare]